MGSATPSYSGDTEHNGVAASGKPVSTPKTKDCRSGRVGGKCWRDNRPTQNFVSDQGPR